MNFDLRLVPSEVEGTENEENKTITVDTYGTGREVSGSVSHRRRPVPGKAAKR